MPDPIKPIEPTTPNPTPQPAAPVTPVTPPAPALPKVESGADDPVLKVLFADLNLPPKAEPTPVKPAEPTPPVAAPVPAPTSTPTPATPPVTPTTPTPPPAEVVTKPNLEAMVQDQVRQAMDSLHSKATPPETPPVTPAQPPTPTPAPADDLSGWTDEEIAELEIAQYAEKAKPDQYKGQVAKLKKWRSDLETYITKAREKNPDRTLDAQDEEFISWVEKNQPRYAPGEKRKLERSMIEEAAAQRAEKVAEEKMRDRDRKIRELENLPKVERNLTQYHQRIAELMEKPDQGGNEALVKVVKRMKEVGVETAAKEMPTHVRAVLDAYKLGQNIVKEFLALEYGLTEFNTQNPSPSHQWIAQFIRRQDDYTLKQPDTQRVRETVVNGVPVRQTFLPSMEYRTLALQDPAKAHQYWTWNTEDYQRMLEVNTKWQAAMNVKQVEDELAAAGYVRKPEQPVSPSPAPNPAHGGNGNPTPNPNPATPPTPTPIKSPVAAVTTAPGAASSTPPTSSKAMSDVELEVLGLK